MLDQLLVTGHALHLLIVSTAILEGRNVLDECYYHDLLRLVQLTDCTYYSIDSLLCTETMTTMY